jgi:hypothetical protein
MMTMMISIMEMMMIQMFLSVKLLVVHIDVIGLGLFRYWLNNRVLETIASPKLCSTYFILHIKTGQLLIT